MSKLGFLLNQIQDDIAGSPGFYERRVDGNLFFPTYVGLNFPVGLPTFSAILPKNFKSRFSQEDANGFTVRFGLIDSDPNKFKIFLMCSDKKYIDIFLFFLEDLLGQLEVATSDEGYVIQFNYALAKWRDFFRHVKKGLSKVEQIGLVGELHVLRYLLQNQIDGGLKSWMGPHGATHDFSFPLVDLEIKSICDDESSLVKISSEYQLSNEEKYLYLIKVNFSESLHPYEGESLPDLISSIRDICTENDKSLFNAKLGFLGYFDQDTDSYNVPIYSVPSLDIYEISNNFPRIIRTELHQSITDVRYTLNLDMVKDHRIHIDDLLKKIKICQS